MKLSKVLLSGYQKTMFPMMATLFILSILAFTGHGQQGNLQASDAPYFEDPDSFRVTLLVSPEEAGEIEGDGKYVPGDEVTIEAEPNAGYQFLHWTDDARGVVVSSDEEYEFIMPDEEVTLTAHFVEAME